MPELYEGVGAKGTDKVVLELPRVLNERYGGSAHPQRHHLRRCLRGVHEHLQRPAGLDDRRPRPRRLRPHAATERHARAAHADVQVVARSSSAAWPSGSAAGRAAEINFMVGQAFAIAAASYFPLLFMSVWWRGMTMKGAATGMLDRRPRRAGLHDLINLSDLKLVDLTAFWVANPLIRILCEQPAIWTVPLAIGLMVVVSKAHRGLGARRHPHEDARAARARAARPQAGIHPGSRGRPGALRGCSPIFPLGSQWRRRAV
jgi:cation/acetate symporter